MTEIRIGTWAERDGRVLPVRSVRRGVWQEWEPLGTTVRLVGPELGVEDLDRLVDVRPTGVVAGHRFTLRSAAGDRVEILDWIVGDDVAATLGLSGNRYDGWRGEVPLADVEDVREDVHVLHERAGPP